jgi:hypothetical protein
MRRSPPMVERTPNWEAFGSGLGTPFSTGQVTHGQPVSVFLRW